MINQRTLHLTATIAAAGGAAWLAKLAVIAASDGATDGTAEILAGILYLLGIVLLAGGASALTLRLARGGGRLAAGAAVLAAPVLFWLSYVAIEGVAKAAVGDAGPAWFDEEVGILMTGAVWLVVGLAALKRD